MPINLEKKNKSLMKIIFDSIIEKEVSSLNDIVKELCSYSDIVIVDIESNEKLLKNKKEIFITFYSTNDSEQLFNLTIVVFPTKDGEIRLDGITITNKSTLKAFTATF